MAARGKLALGAQQQPGAGGVEPFDPGRVDNDRHGPAGTFSARSRRSSPAASVTSQSPAARKTSAPASSEATIVAGGAMLNRRNLTVC